LPRLYVFIDESMIPGDPNSPFFAGAVWCAPKPTIGIPKALRPTVLSMKDFLRGLVGHRVEEIRYSHGAGRHASDLIRVGLMEAGRDDTISGRDVRLASQGIGFTTAVIDRRSEACLIREKMQPDRLNPDLGNLIRARAISSLLGPALRYGQEMELGVVLDGANWKPGVESYFGRSLERLLMPPLTTCQVEYGDSRRVLGLQFADLVAGTLRDYISRNENGYALDIVMKRVIHRLGARNVSGVKPLGTE